MSEIFNSDVKLLLQIVAAMGERQRLSTMIRVRISDNYSAKKLSVAGRVADPLGGIATDHGCFRSYLHHYKMSDTPNFPNCEKCTEDVEHIIYNSAHSSILKVLT